MAKGQVTNFAVSEFAQACISANRRLILLRMTALNLRGRTVALYGRFSPGVREVLVAEIGRRGGQIARDLTRRSDILVIGARAIPLIAGDRLAGRIAAARGRRTPVFSEPAFAEALAGASGTPETLPLSSIRGARLSREEIDLLGVFDIVRVVGDNCRFADAAALKSAAELLAAGQTLTEVIRTLEELREAPAGRRKLVVSRAGPALQWDEGLTGLDGQGLLPLDDQASLDDLYEAAAAAELSGDLDAAARLYESAARSDKKDPIAPYNLGVAHLARGRPGDAALAFRQAIARDPTFVEARYNLAAAAESLGKDDVAHDELVEALKIDASYADARFNLAQLNLKRGALSEAKAHFERYLASDPPPDWADKARRAILYCSAASEGREDLGRSWCGG